MKCDKWYPEISAYLDGELSARRRLRMERHLAKCSGCRRRLEEMQHQWETLEGLPQAEASASLEIQVLTKLPREATTKPEAWSFLPLGNRHLATAIAITLVLGLFSGFFLGREVYTEVLAYNEEDYLVDSISYGLLNDEQFISAEDVLAEFYQEGDAG